MTSTGERGGPLPGEAGRLKRKEGSEFFFLVSNLGFSIMELIYSQDRKYTWRKMFYFFKLLQTFLFFFFKILFIYS